MSDFLTAEFETRIGKLQQIMGQIQVDLAILNQSPDLYYFTGSVQPLYLLVPVSGKPLLLARKAVERIKAEAPHIPCEYFQNTQELLRILDGHGFVNAKRLGFTLENTSYATVARWLQMLAGSVAVELSNEIRYLRMVKSPAELEVLSAAGKIIAGIPGVVREKFRPGMTELELSVEIESYLRRQGHGGIIRSRMEAIEMGNGVCAAGGNALVGTKFDGICGGTGLTRANPFGATDQPIPRNQPVILDFAFNYRGYHVDQTRMFCWGIPDVAVVRAFQTMLEIERVLMEEMKPGKFWSELYATAAQLAEDYGYGAEFMGCGTEKVRFVGHGIGLELDEPPILAPKMDFPILSGMTVALEPKVALPGVGVIGNEDTVWVREDGCECLTLAAPEMIIVD